MKFTVKGTLPNMNEIIQASKRHWSKYHEMKKTYTTLVAYSCRNLKSFNCVDVYITWYCKDRRVDKDGIIAGQKFLFDGLQEAGKLSNDGWKQIRDIKHSFEVDKENPRIVVELIEVE